MPQVVRIASPSPSTSNLVCESFSWTAAFISFKLWIVTILRERFVPGFDMDPEYRGSARLEKVTEGASCQVKVDMGQSTLLVTPFAGSYLHPSSAL
jgi:hypothetical protein